MIDTLFLSRRTSRRTLLSGIAAGIGAVLLVTPVLAQRGPATVPIEELMKPGDMPELSLGSREAPVTIVEYASMTCPHCASFHVNVFPKLKEKYIDTGKARFIFREFPLDDLAAAVSMLSRCVGGGDEGAMSFVSDMFKSQDKWLVRGNPLPKLFEMAKQAGFTQDSFDKCLSDQALLDKVTAVRERASTKFGVNSTPTFFINGKRLNGVGIADFDKAIEAIATAGSTPTK